MQRILTSEQMRNADRYTIERLGISSQILVERAGTAVTEEILKKFQGGRVLVCIGKGNNGEDGKYIASLLRKKHGFSVDTAIVGESVLEIFNKKFDIIVDCVFGTGLNRQVDGIYKEIIEKINQSKAFVISCDIPSGLNSDTGKPMGVCVKAKMTVAIQEYKLGHFLNDGPDYCGNIILKDIGISVWDSDFAKRLENIDLKKFFPSLNRNVNKGSFGKVAIIGGSKNFIGGTILSYNGLSALKMGNGYVNLAIPESLISIYAGACLECTITPLKDCDGKILFDKESLKSLLSYDCIAIGMGLGVSEEVYKTLVYLIDNYRGRLLIDADGLNCLSKYGVEVLYNKKCEIVLTPHIKEFSRLINVETAEIMSDIISFSKDFASRFGVVLVLKSATSVITDGNEVFINTTGCSGMAKAGSGDVLSGIISGMLAKKKELLESSVAGCFLFGLAGEICQSKFNEYSITPLEVVTCIADAINSL